MDKKPGDLVECVDIKSILQKIKDKDCEPDLNNWAMIQAHFKVCQDCVNYYNNEILGL